MRHFRIATKARTRLACVKHAASVRSEPGSNSRLKLVAWRKKYPGFNQGQPAKRIVDRSIYSDHWRSKSSNGFEQILAHRIGCQRARPPCPAEWHTNNLTSIGRCLPNVNTLKQENLGFPQASSGSAKLLKNDRMRGRGRLEEARHTTRDAHSRSCDEVRTCEIPRCRCWDF